MNTRYTCVACGDTGTASDGGPCGPCAKKGREPLRDAVVSGLRAIFEEAKRLGKPGPDLLEMQAFLTWACEPRVQYAAGYRDRCSNAVGVFAGPTPDRQYIFEVVPGEARPAYIIELTRPKCWGGKVRHRPIAKWKDGTWRLKKRRP